MGRTHLIFITSDNMVNKIDNLDLTKSNPVISIPTKTVVGNSDIFAPIYVGYYMLFCD